MRTFSSRDLAAGVVLFVFLTSLAPPVRAAEDLYLGVALDLNSRYFWRGMTASEGAVLQPSFWTSLFNTNLMGWANLPLDDAAGRRGFDEINVFIEGTSPRRPLVIVPGVNVYTDPRAEEDEDSWTAELALTFYAPVGPVWLYWENDVDIRAYSGAYYAEFGVQAGRDIAKNINLDVSLAQSYASADFNQAYLGIAKNALTYLTAHAGISLRLAGILSLTPHVEAVFTTDAGLREELGGAVRFNFGLTATLGQD